MTPLTKRQLPDLVIEATMPAYAGDRRADFYRVLLLTARARANIKQLLPAWVLAPESRPRLFVGARESIYLSKQARKLGYTVRERRVGPDAAWKEPPYDYLYAPAQAPFDPDWLD